MEYTLCGSGKNGTTPVLKSAKWKSFVAGSSKNTPTIEDKNAKKKKRKKQVKRKAVVPLVKGTKTRKIPKTINVVISYKRMDRHLRRMLLHNQHKHYRLFNPPSMMFVAQIKVEEQKTHQGEEVAEKWTMKSGFVLVMQEAARAMFEKIVVRTAKLSRHRQTGRSGTRNIPENELRLHMMEHDVDLGWHTIRVDARRKISK